MKDVSSMIQSFPFFGSIVSTHYGQVVNLAVILALCVTKHRVCWIAESSHIYMNSIYIYQLWRYIQIIFMLFEHAAYTDFLEKADATESNERS